ncbi:hypothetical protein M409DRAFT_57131 [Zasmidium cellare ATCC 36951]|uniref:Uncharacterized protein n=1 Tax=Zasmidium cellare ATCC 36951 TaxID=1080233 RepID=A0A6A6CA16_ZASCE|nr:uncharacterized protein M409DRAFT_57131 [Zasmidium cellare ATCC 36951]KAF2164037.1 hypothetical protein M409DRAFT_57131 [Zasmidium cellare ATCC 36951]
MASNVENASKLCRLLGLPAELRNEIYEYALSTGFVRVGDPTERGHRISRPNTALAPLTMTCKQIYKESRNIIYSVNKIILALPSDEKKSNAWFDKIVRKHKACGMRQGIEIWFIPGQTETSFLSRLRVMGEGLRYLNNTGVKVLIEARVHITALKRSFRLHFGINGREQIRNEMLEYIQWSPGWSHMPHKAEKVFNFADSAFSAVWSG